MKLSEPSEVIQQQDARIAALESMLEDTCQKAAKWGWLRSLSPDTRQWFGEHRAKQRKAGELPMEGFK